MEKEKKRGRSDLRKNIYSCFILNCLQALTLRPVLLQFEYSCNAWGRFEQQLFQNRADYHLNSCFSFNHEVQQKQKKGKKKEMKTQTNDSCWLIGCLFASIALLYLIILCFQITALPSTSTKRAKWDALYRSQFYMELIPRWKKKHRNTFFLFGKREVKDMQPWTFQRNKRVKQQKSQITEKQDPILSKYSICFKEF